MRRKHLLRSLNLFGLDHLDPVILASLADESTLLLIGRHGTAKSELLNRIAAALKLKHRHYNASLIAFDDLLGFPVPNPERTALTYLRTEGDLWDCLMKYRVAVQNTRTSFSRSSTNAASRDCCWKASDSAGRQ